MESYLEEYGHHFNKRLYHYAVSLMRNHKGEEMKPLELDRVNEFLKSHGVTVKNNVGYDCAYTVMMAMSDYLGSSVPDDRHLALYVQDYVDDPDGNETRAFDEYYINCVRKGVFISWADML